MFKKKLTAELYNIFDINKISFSAPSDSNEQDTLFVNIASCKYRPKANMISGRVTGKITLFSNNEKLPFGFFIKMIHKSTVDDKELFFYNIDENTNYAGAIGLVERTAEFLYFYSESYDPNKGELTSLTF